METVPRSAYPSERDSPRAYHFRVPMASHGERLDVYLSRELPLSRAKIKHLLLDGHVTQDGKILKKVGEKLKGGERIDVLIPAREPAKIKGEAIPLDILYEDDFLVVVNKPPGIVVHPALGNWSGTLVNALIHHFKKLSGVDPARPGIVHRLDKDTSGILLAAKQDAAHLELSRQFKDREVEKVYLVLVHGRVRHAEGKIEQPIGRHPKARKKMAVVASGRHAITTYRVLQRLENYTLLECRIKTGRTHQIRVHLSSHGHPVVGDPIYGRKREEPPVSRQLLHAWKIRFKHPLTGKLLAFEAPPPVEMFTFCLRFGIELDLTSSRREGIVIRESHA